MVRLLAVALAIVAARATDNDSRPDLYKKKEPHVSVTNQLTELRLHADSKGELAVEPVRCTATMTKRRRFAPGASIGLATVAPLTTRAHARS